jgi:hypothetical protein
MSITALTVIGKAKAALGAAQAALGAAKATLGAAGDGWNWLKDRGKQKVAKEVRSAANAHLALILPPLPWTAPNARSAIDRD